MTDDREQPIDAGPETGVGPAPAADTGPRLGLTLRAIQVRLRFVAVLAVAFLVVGQWETLRNYWDRVTSLARGARGGFRTVSNDTEYFCPMDPGVVTDWPSKCGICNMALVRRKKGEATPLPSGVVARMQFSPYRLQLAGIRVSPAAYQALAREVVLVGIVTGGEGKSRVVGAELFERDRPLLAEGQAAEVTGEGWGESKALSGTVDGFLDTVPGECMPARVRLTVNDPEGRLRPGQSVTARLRRPVAELEPFRSMPAVPPPLRKGEPRALYVCPAHPEVLRDRPGPCPVDRKDELESSPLLDNQRVAWWCPMHPKVTADRPGSRCGECAGMVLVPRVITYRPEGKVLAIPEPAVVDTGTRKVVYVERMPGMFDGIEVVLGPRCGDAYPVIRGLDPGQNVAAAGAFLIDAETRLNPSLAAAYFGSGRGSRPSEDRPAARPKPLCPVTGKPLGSMGEPVKVVVRGKEVWLCCEGCEARLRKAPEVYLRKVP